MAALLLAISAATLAAAAEERDVAGSPYTDTRKELLSEYESAYVPQHATRSVPVWSTGPQAAGEGAALSDDPNIVKLAPFEVDGSFKGDELHAIFLRQKADAHTREVLARLGIAVHQLRLRKVTFSAVTLLFVPVAVSVGW